MILKKKKEIGSGRITHKCI